MKPRGIVITPSFSLNQENLITEWMGMDPIYLRKCALYWDMIDCPEGIIGGASFGELGKDANILEKEGILQRTRGHLIKKEKDTFVLTFAGEYPREFWILAQFYTLLKHASADANWSLGQPFNNLVLPSPQATEFIFVEPTGQAGKAFKLPPNLLEIQTGPSIEVELYNSLPVPIPDVPMERILSFKRKRRDELIRFRHAMDELYLKIQDSADVVRAKDTSIDEIELSLADLHKAMKETPMQKISSTIKTEVSLSDIVQGAVAGMMAGNLFGTSHDLLAVSAVLGATALPALKMTINLSAFKPKQVPSEFKDYAYLYFLQRELK